MIFACVFLGFLLTLSSSLLYFSVKKNLEFLEQQENMLSLLESSLQELDVCYKRIDKKVKLELFSDEPAVKELVDDMKYARSTVASIVEQLTGEKNIIESQATEETNVQERS